MKVVHNRSNTGLRILFTNAALAHRQGTELYTYDIVTNLRDAGHQVEVYSPELGGVAEELRQSGIRVFNGIEQIGSPPDIIHAQHNGPTMAAAARFPDTPIVYVSHGTAPIDEQPPPRLLQIRRYVAVSAPIADMLELRCGIPRKQITTVFNFVNKAKYPERAHYSSTPQRALCFSNHLTLHSGAEVLRNAVSKHGILFDLKGISAENPIRNPEEILGHYDLVFARGRAALEAMAAGCAVILCDIEGMGPMVSSSNFDFLRSNNFGAACFTAAISPSEIEQQLRLYDAADARAVSRRVRDEADIKGALEALCQVYRDAIEEHTQERITVSADDRALQNARFLEWLAIDSRRETKAQLEFWKAQAELRAAELQRLQSAPLWRVYRVLSKLNPLATYLLGKANRLTNSLLRSLPSSDSNKSRALPPHLGSAAKLNAEFGDEQTEVPRLACVVMSYNDEPWVVAAVQSLQNQKHAEVEIVVVNSGRSGTAERLKQHGIDVLTLECPVRLFPGAARNIGIAATKAPYVSFLAADCLAEPDWAIRRIVAHQSGHLAVSSSITNPYGNKLSAWASYVSLYVRRLPHTAPSEVIHFGVSYARKLFDTFGLFNEELRASEDTEFNTRIGASVNFLWEPGIRTAHRHPRSPVELLKDHFRRGGLTASISSSLENADTRRRTAKSTLRRIPSTIPAALRGVDPEYRQRVLLSSPLIVLGLLSYAAGALLKKTRIEESVGSSDLVTKPRRKVLALLVCRNELHRLPGYIENVAPQVDGIIALDDGSTDGSAEFLESCPAVLELVRHEARPDHVWDEPRNQREVISAALRHNPDWLIAIDADERIEHGFRLLLEQELDQADGSDLNVCYVNFRELWNAADRFRADGIWHHKRFARLFRAGPLSNFEAPSFHGAWSSHVHDQDQRRHFADVNIYHMAMIEPEARRERRDKYLQLDPDRKFQPMGYDYLTDERGIRLHAIDPSRRYYPSLQPGEIAKTKVLGSTTQLKTSQIAPGKARAVAG